MDLALNNLQWLIYHQTKLNQTIKINELIYESTLFLTSLDWFLVNIELLFICITQDMNFE